MTKLRGDEPYPIAETERPGTGHTGEGPADPHLADGILIFFLCGVGVAQPLYDVLSRGAEFFIARRSQPIDVLAMVAVLSVILPGVLVAALALVDLLSRRGRGVLFCIVTSGLLSIVFLQLLKHAGDLPGLAVALAAAAAGTVCGLTFFRWRLLRERVFLIPATLVTAALPFWFLFATPVRKVILQNRIASDAAARAAPELKTPVLLVILDELATTTLMNEAREIDAELFPGIHGLAADSTWYRNATTVADFTILAAPAILTGRYPDHELLPTVSDYPENLFTLLGKANDMVVYESTTDLCPADVCANEEGGETFTARLGTLFSDLAVVYGHVTLPDELAEKKLPPVSAAWYNFASPAAYGGSQSLDEDKTGNRVATFRHFARSIRRANGPALYYLHAALPHYPWRYTPAGKRYAFSPAARSLGLTGKTWSADAWRSTQGFQRHVLQTMFVDKLISEILDKLKEERLYDRSLIILTSDHGVSFKPGGARRKLTATNYEDVMPVPLFVKLPGQRSGSVDDSNVETVDILPTIAATQQITIPWRTDGRPLSGSSMEPRATKTVFNKTGERLTFDADFAKKYDALNWKLNLMGTDGGRQRLYRIGPHDPYKTLIGRQAPVGRDSAARFEGDLDLPKLFDEVDPDGPAIPALVTGRIYPEDARACPCFLAVTVNGTIQAITRTYQEGTMMQFAAMVPEQSFRSGKNRVEVFVVRDGPGGMPRLSKVSIGGRPYFLERKNGREVIRSADGKAYPIKNRRFNGKVKRGAVRKDVIVFRGWAAEGKERRMSDAILVFENNEFLFSGTTARDRRTPEDGPAAAGSGFKFSVPKAGISDAGGGVIRFFAISHHGYASELRYARNFQWRKKGRPGG